MTLFPQFLEEMSIYILFGKTVLSVSVVYYTLTNCSRKNVHRTWTLSLSFPCHVNSSVATESLAVFRLQDMLLYWTWQLLCWTWQLLYWTWQLLCWMWQLLYWTWQLLCWTWQLLYWTWQLLCWTWQLLYWTWQLLCWMWQLLYWTW